MGLYKYKCDSNPIWSDVYCLKTKSIVVYTNINQLNEQRLVCDMRTKPPQEAIDAHNIYYESKRWHEHGCFDEEGIVRNNQCIHFFQALAKLPTTDDPGLFSFSHL
jgi:hypothetical protein